MDDPDIDTPLAPPPAPPASSGGTGSGFVPDPIRFQQLKDMGFGEEDTVAALELARNNFEVALQLLLQDDDVKAALAAQKEESVDINAPLIKELLQNSRVHASLVDPRIQDALEAMVKDPHTAGSFMQDETVRPVLMLVSQLISGRM